MKKLSHLPPQVTQSNPHLTEAARKEVTDLFTLIRHYELLTASLKASVVALVEKDAGIDLASGGYDLNLSTGELTAKEAQQGVSA